MGTRKNALVTLLAAATLLGCASSEDSNGNGGGGGGGGGNTSDPDSFTPAPEDVVDDLEDGDDAIIEHSDRGGSWYTFNDGTAGGMMAPSGDTFQPRQNTDNGSDYAAAMQGKGFTEWGAGMGFDFADDGVTRPKGVYDASGHQGITFIYRSKTEFSVALVMPEVVPTDEGGTCAATDMCSDTHQTKLSASNTWVRAMLPFSAFKQGGWGKPAQFNPATLMSMHFLVAQNLDFEVWVDDIAFY